MIKKLHKVIRKHLLRDEGNTGSLNSQPQNLKQSALQDMLADKEKLQSNQAKLNKTNKAHEQFLNQAQPSLLQELEPRIMFDGAAIEAVDLADGVTEQEQIYVLDAIDQNEQAHAAESLLEAIAANAEGFQTDYSQFKEVVIIDSRVKDPHLLINAVARDAAIEIIDIDEDGVAAIAQILEKYSNLDAIHIISHGDQAILELGSIDLNLTNINDYQAQLQQWGQALSHDGDILFYGCNVAEGEQGHVFVDQLKAYTSADIAASTDLTGHIDKAGDWELEYKDKVEATILEVNDYRHILVTNAPSSRTIGNPIVTTSNVLDIDVNQDGKRFAIAESSQVKIYDYDTNEPSLWSEQTLFSASSGDQSKAVAISSDGRYAVIGVANTSSPNAYMKVYYDATGTGSWSQIGSNIEVGDSANAVNDVVINDNGTRVAISSNRGGGTYYRQVDVYNWNGSSWDIISYNDNGINWNSGNTNHELYGADGGGSVLNIAMSADGNR